MAPRRIQATPRASPPSSLLKMPRRKSSMEKPFPQPDAKEPEARAPSTENEDARPRQLLGAAHGDEPIR
uniref:Uncharacterized protein n=1 Tax=Setaria italica TaxID=4555 RepID=K3XP16_SETIT